MRLPQGAGFRGCSHSFTFRLLHSLDLQVAPTAEHKILRAARPFTPRIARKGYPFQDVASLRVRHGQLTRQDLHPLDCSLVGCSPVARPGQPPSVVRTLVRVSVVPCGHRQLCESSSPAGHRQFCETPPRPRLHRPGQPPSVVRIDSLVHATVPASHRQLGECRASSTPSSRPAPVSCAEPRPQPRVRRFPGWPPPEIFFFFLLTHCTDVRYHACTVVKGD